MGIQVDQALCTGCGACVTECSVGAIKLVAEGAVVDEKLCTGCGACAEVCPNGAITAIAAIAGPESETATPVLAAVESRPALTPVRGRLESISAPVHNLAPLAGTALAYFGREIAPRVIDVVIASVERRLARSDKDIVSSASLQTSRSPVQRRRKRRQVRVRGGLSNNRNLNGRR